jgi:GNAT superfamily N-acetyltransferase
MERKLAVSLSGITPLPAGHVATIKSYLARPVPAAPETPELPAGIALAPLGGREVARYRALFTTLGERWLWWSHLMLAPEELAVLLDHPGLEACAVVRGGRDIGLLELDFRELPVADLAFLGLIEGETGQGLGTALIANALAAMARRGARQATVNTCTFDSPHALGFYRRHGFAVTGQAVEIVPDPRLCGLLPMSAAPHVPILA